VKITGVDALHLRLPTVENKSDGTQDVMVVRVTTDAGHAGYGEAVTSGTVVRAIIEAPRSTPHRHGLGVALIGTDPLDPIARWRDMYDASSWYGRRGVVIHAISAIDTALWDIAGKVAEQPCHALWGSRRDRVRAYASMLFPDTPAEAAEIATQRLERGFTAMKFGWGSFGYDEAFDRRMMRSIRDVVGDDFTLMVDAGRRWSVETAIRYAGWLFGEYGILWLEEPLDPDDLEGYRKLCRVAPGRIAGGEADEAIQFFDELIKAGLKVVQPDIGRAGGPTIARKISSLAHQTNVWCVPHCFGTGISLAASLHWMASAEAAQFNEYPVTRSPLRNELVSGLPDLVNGDVAIPTGPGLGISINEDVIQRYLVRT
jgi:L-alanine-DL-glutamate epimerase-like enolase superfamily enzyme